MSVMDPIISDEEILAKAWEIIGGDALRVWYEDLKAKRQARRDTIRIKDGTDIYVGKTYDLTVELSRAGKTQVLRGYHVDSRGALWSDQVINVHKPKAEPGREWMGPRRELMPHNILSAVEVAS